MESLQEGDTQGLVTCATHLSEGQQKKKGYISTTYKIV
jgi:hypothetical protein